MMRVTGYVKNFDNFDQGCVYSAFAHADIPDGEEWTSFEAITTNGNMRKPTGYMSSGFSSGANRLLPETYSFSREEACKKAYKISSKYRWIKTYGIEDVYPVQVSIGGFLDD